MDHILDAKDVSKHYVRAGLVVLGGDSRSESCEFESQHCILDGIFHIDFLKKSENK